MTDFWQRLKQRKLVQWAVAYVAFAFALIQVLDVVADSYAWPHVMMHLAFGVLALGFIVTLVLAWYHGERGAQRVGSMEIMILALLLVIGGGLLWHFARPVVLTASEANTALAQRAGSTPPATPNSDGRETKVAASTSVAGTTEAIPAAPLAAAAIPAKSIAVLPFENLSSDKDNAYFASGMQDLILTKLADIGDLKVIARTSTMQYGSHPQNLTLVGKQLGVAAILEGSVQKAGNQVLINVQLIDVKTDSHLWAESYTRNLTNIFGVEGEVAGKVAHALNAKLTASEAVAVARVPTTNPQAYTLYLKGQHERDMFFTTVDRNASAAVARKAVGYLKQAIALDPNFAAAYANLAWVEVALSNMNKGFGIVDKSVSFEIAMAHARKALSLQPDLAMAHAAEAWILFLKGDLAQGLPEVQRAAQLAPGNASISALLSVMYLSAGEWQQADAQAHKAVSADPRDGANYAVAAKISILLRHDADARQMLERGLAVSPGNAQLHKHMGNLLLLLGDFAGARAQYVQLPADSNDVKFAGLAAAWRLSRNDAQALKAAQQMPSPPKIYWDAGQREIKIGRIELALGNHTAAKAAFTQGRAEVKAALRIAQFYHARLYNALAYAEMGLDHRDIALQAIAKAITFDIRTNDQYHERAPVTGTATAMFVADDDYESKAEILAHFGDAKGATDILRQLFQTQGTGNVISPALLRLDPVWDPIRKDPSFQSLLNEYGQAEPASASSAAADG